LFSPHAGLLPQPWDGTPAPVAGETVAMPSATLLPTGEPAKPLVVEPSATPATLPTDEAGTPQAAPLATSVIELPSIANPTPDALPQSAPAALQATIAVTPVPPLPNVTTLALQGSALQPSLVTIVEQVVLPNETIYWRA